MKHFSVIAIFIILIIFNIGAVIWALIVRSDLIHCETHESPLCPSYFCGSKSPTLLGSPCTAANKSSELVAYRTDSKGATQCQVTTMPPNVTAPTTDYTKPIPSS